MAPILAAAEELVMRLVPQVDEEDPRTLRLLQLSLRFLNSRMPVGPLTLGSVGERVRRKLLQAGRASDALTFSELVKQLEQGHELLHLAPALQLLGSLLGTGTQAPSIPHQTGAALLSRMGSRAAPSSVISKGEVSAPEPGEAPETETAAASAPSPALPARNVHWEVGSTAGSLSEAALVRDLLFVMQNIDGTHVKWDETRDAFVLPQGTTVPPGARQLAGRLAELGWLFRQVSSFVHEGGESGGGGLVPQALRHALQAELDEWYQLLAVLEAQRQTELTLLQLIVWSAEPMQRLLLMAQLARSCGRLKGGAMAVAIERHERHGDPVVRGYIHHLLRAACAPLFQMVRAWVLHGELTDAYDEFFIETHATPLSQLWERRYTLREGMLPGFLPRELATRVLLVGKALNFIRLCCADPDWSLDLSAPLPPRASRPPERVGASPRAPASAPSATAERVGAEVEAEGAALDAASLSRIEYGKEAMLSAVVGRAAALANAHLLDLLLNRYELRAHCANLQQFLLLGKGDFVQALMEHLAPQLARPAAQLHRHHLLSLVESSVRSSSAASADGEHATLLKHLDVALSKTPGGTGWEAFSLDYQLGSPCDAVLSAGAIATYRRIFTFLWRLKRVEHSLTAVWRKHCTTARLLQVLHRDVTMHGCHLLRNEMVHFVYNLQYYLMFEVIECASLELDEQLAGATELDAIVGAHGSFLDAVLRKAMLRPEDEGMHHALKALFDSMLHFARAQDQLYMSLLEQKAAARQHAAAVAASEAKGTWGSRGGVKRVQLDAIVVEPRFKDQMLAAAAEYRQRFSTFFSGVTRHASYDLAFLSFRLDFNEYYESLSLGEAEPEG